MVYHFNKWNAPQVFSGRVHHLKFRMLHQHIVGKTLIKYIIGLLNYIKPSVNDLFVLNYYWLDDTFSNCKTTSDVCCFSDNVCCFVTMQLLACPDS